MPKQNSTSMSNIPYQFHILSHKKSICFNKINDAIQYIKNNPDIYDSWWQMKVRHNILKRTMFNNIQILGQVRKDGVVTGQSFRTIFENKRKYIGLRWIMNKKNAAEWAIVYTKAVQTPDIAQG